MRRRKTSIASKLENFFFFFNLAKSQRQLNSPLPPPCLTRWGSGDEIGAQAQRSPPPYRGERKIKEKMPSVTTNQH